MTTATTDTLTSEMIGATRRLIAELRSWAVEDRPQIGHRSNRVAVRNHAARSLQQQAVALSGRLEGLLDAPDRLEDVLINLDTYQDTANMQAHECGIRDARGAAFDAAISRRNDRDGIRYIFGRRHRRTVDGGWEMY